jgi:hypothetical protein
MRDTNDRSPAPNFTQACIVMFGINITWIFVMIWAIWGLLGVAVTGWVVNQIINQIERLRD